MHSLSTPTIILLGTPVHILATVAGTLTSVHAHVRAYTDTHFKN